MIRPIPDQHGVGFTSTERLPQYAEKYREEQVGRHWNYHFTAQNYYWPEKIIERKGANGKLIIDGFSPNLNKSLHVGHLRQLALANSLKRILRENGKFVALLGASQGVYQYAQNELSDWFNFVRYNPDLYYDVLMPRDEDIVPRYKKKIPHKDPIATDFNGKPWEYEEECEVWNGPQGEVIVVRSDGRPLYAFQDIAFAKIVAPDYYITGAEQKEHFESLGLGDKHLPMGLVLGTDGKKMKSRTGDNISASEILQQIIEQLDETNQPKKLAWNVAAWNFLHVTRPQNVKFNAKEWTRPDSPGMYITYTYARVASAIKAAKANGQDCFWMHPIERKAVAHDLERTDENFNDWDDIIASYDQKNPDPQFDLTQDDINLLGTAGLRDYYMNRAIETLDPAPLAHFTHDLSRKINNAYHAEKIQGGRYGFGYAIRIAHSNLQFCLSYLGMFGLEQV